VVGRSGDDMVEAVEVGAGFAVGVQWHAELLVGRSEGLALFEALVRAADAHGRDAARAA
jgi:gamma-glutamyl-gamma-aminobutyrate hydrolase PuuD